MSESADVVVIGGGILGCSAALHLKEAGAGEVVLLERDELARGTSSAGAGFIGLWGAGYVGAWQGAEIEVERYGLEFYGQLAEAGYEFDYRSDGNLWAATNADSWDSYIDVIARHPAVPDKLVLSADEVAEVTGIVEPDAIVGGVLHPGGGQVSAPKATLAIADCFTRAGGRIDVHRAVSRILIRRGRIVGVETSTGTIDTGAVVLAAGAWTNSLLRELGIWLPVVPLVATRLVTESLGVPPTMPTLMLQEFSFAWLREEQGGLMWGCSYEGPPRYDFVDAEPPLALAEVPRDAIPGVQRVGSEMERVIPALARSRAVMVAQGAPTYTSDLRALVGPQPGIDGLYVVAGCNEAGVTHGPGYGKLIADHMSGAGPTGVEMNDFRIDRFGGTLTRPQDVVKAMKSVESIFSVTEEENE